MNEAEIQRKRRESEENATRERARILNLQYLDTRSFENSTPLIRDVIETSMMHRDHIIPLQAGDNEIPFAFMITSQTPQSLLSKMRREYEHDGKHVEFFLISNSAYQVFMLRYDPPQQVHYDDIRIASKGDSETIASVSQTLNSVSTDRVFDYLIDQADKLGASDIHIENMRDKIRIRMRVDGILHPVADLNRERYRILMGELSTRANISSASRRPQSGHMQQDIHRNGSSHILNIRVETVPTMYGQDAVLRLFNFDENLLNLDLLGLTPSELEVVRGVISHPRGLVMMVGPTGSGKSTTLYSILNALNTPERKIITLEDPIEYGITGISQIPIDTTNGGSFADALRSVLRLDPDVVMVGEIRDADTARTSIQASITGHLVLSSFHANTTATAFSRMIDLIGTNPIFASSIRLLIAQRLVRKLADSKEAYHPDEATKQYIAQVLSGLNINFDELVLYRPVPTEEYPFGFQGRTVLMEQMQVSEDIQSYLRGDLKDVNAEAIEQSAKMQGMLTLEQRGVLAALQGETTLDEVSRVI